MHQYAAQYVSNLPNFLCLQVTRQFEAGKKSNRWHQGYTLVAKLSFNQGREERTLDSLNGKPVGPGKASRRPPSAPKANSVSCSAGSWGPTAKPGSPGAVGKPSAANASPFSISPSTNSTRPSDSVSAISPRPSSPIAARSMPTPPLAPSRASATPLPTFHPNCSRAKSPPPSTTAKSPSATENICCPCKPPYRCFSRQRKSATKWNFKTTGSLKPTPPLPLDRRHRPHSPPSRHFPPPLPNPEPASITQNPVHT